MEYHPSADLLMRYLIVFYHTTNRSDGYAYVRLLSSDVSFHQFLCDFIQLGVVTIFGEYLRTLRGKRTLREIESLSGISYEHIRRLEKGYDPRTGKEIKPSADVLEKLPRAYNVPLVRLLQASGQFNIPVPGLPDVWVDDLELEILLNTEGWGRRLKLRGKPLTEDERKRLLIVALQMFPEKWRDSDG